jgi:CXXX repeat modification system protein
MKRKLPQESTDNNNGLLSDNSSRKQIGKVTIEESKEIKMLYERKNGLIELFKTFSGMSKSEIENNALYDKIVKDMGEVTVKFQNWWDNTSKKYNWENLPGHKWEIDFDSCIIYIVKQ